MLKLSKSRSAPRSTETKQTVRLHYSNNINKYKIKEKKADKRNRPTGRRWVGREGLIVSSCDSNWPRRSASNQTAPVLGCSPWN